MTLHTPTSIPASGVHRYRSRQSSRALCRSLEAAGAACFVLDLHGVADKAALLRATYAAIGAPAWAGGNWDALEDMLGDLGWLPASRYVLIVTGGRSLVESDPAAWAMFLDILTTATGYWLGRGIPFAVLVRGATA
jgi:hypothetical protein